MLKYNIHIRSFLLVLLPSILILYSCEQTHIEIDQIIATIDGEEIFLEEFNLFYELDPNFGIDSSGFPALKDELYFYIHQKLALRKAEQEGLTTDPIFLMAVDWEKKQAMLRELYRRKVLDEITVSEDELRKKYENDNIEVHVKHLFSGSRQGMELIRSQLESGSSFEELAPHVFKDSLLAESGGDLGWHKIGDLDADFAAAVLPLNKDDISDIIKTRFGYHIIKLVNRRSQKMLSDNEYKTRRPTLEKKIRKTKSEAASRQFIADFMEDKNPQLVPAVFLVLWKSLVPNLEDEKEELDSKVYLTDHRIGNCIEELKPILQKDLVVSGDGGIRLGEYLTALKKIPISNRPGFKSRRQFSHQIATWVRDEMLYAEAQKLELDLNEIVMKDVQRYEEEQSYHYFLSQYSENIRIPDYVDEFYRNKDLQILKVYPDLKRFNTKQEWQWYNAGRKLREELNKIPAVIEINEEILSMEAKKINWDRRIRMFMIRKPQ